MRRLMNVVMVLPFLLCAGAKALPNPASENCVKNDGVLEMREDDRGFYGICTWNDYLVRADGVFMIYSECEEWSLLRGQCKRGECQLWDVWVDDDGDLRSECLKPAIAQPVN